MLQDMKIFMNTHRKAIIWNMVIVCICYVHMIFSMNMGVDTEQMINEKSYLLQSWKGIGRQGLVLTKGLLKLTTYNPYFAGVIFLAAFVVLGSLTAFFCWLSAGKNDAYPYGLFLVLFSTCPVWMMQFYFALQRAEVILGLIYTVISVLCFNQFVFYKKRKVYLLPLYLILGVWGFCSYQGNVMFYIGLCIIFILLDFVEHYREKQWQEYAGMILKSMGGFLVVYLVNTVITHLLFGVGGYLQGQIGWGKAGISEIFYRMCYHVYNVFFCLKAEYRSVYPLACLCTAVIFFHFCLKKEMKNSMKGILFLALAGMLATPFLLTIYMGNVPVPRSQSVLQLISAFACMFVCGIWNVEGKGQRKYLWMQRGIVVVSAVAVWFSMSTIFRLQYTDDLRYQEDVRVAANIVEEIQRTEGAAGLPVIFVGRYTSNLNAAAGQAEMYGSSFLGWDYAAGNPTGATGRIIGFMNTMGLDIRAASHKKEKALAAAQDMESYPVPGYISVQDNFVVVKLSEEN